MPGSTFHPLGTKGEYQDGTFVIDQDSEYARFRRAAKEGSPREELVGLVATSTGLRADEIAHMIKKRYLDNHLNTSNPEIKVPYGTKCFLGGGDKTKGSEGGNTLDIEAGYCYACADRANKRWAPDWADYTPKTETSAGRTIPVRDEDTIQILNSYFELYDTVATEATVNSDVKKIAKRAGILKETPYSDYRSHWPTPHNLRETFGTLIVKRGGGAHQVKALMGHANISTSMDYVRLVGRDLHEFFDENWPANTQTQ